MKKALLIHGPKQDNILEKIVTSLENSYIKFSKIVLVYYSTEQDYISEIKKNFTGFNFIPVESKDVFNPGFANINRQINTVNKGLKYIDDDNFVVKLRNDQCINFNKLFNIVGKFNIEQQQNKIFSTNCYTRKDRLYHPSDMLLCGYAKVLKNYYDVPLSKYTEIEIQMQIRERIENGEDMIYNPFSPESYLFRHFLIKNQWKILETKEDSINALRKYTYIFNSWDIDFIWKKKRTYPFKKENSLILPHYMRISPFPYGPVEDVRCFSRNELFNEYFTIKDIYYILKSRLLFFCWNENLDSYKNILIRYKNRLRKIYLKLLKVLPYVLVHKKINSINM